MAESSSVEYRALVNNTHKMITLIAGDPITVASKLMEKELIPASASGAGAKELVEIVRNHVNVFPEKFGVFIGVLREIPWLRGLAMWLCDECEKLKVMEVKKVLLSHFFFCLALIKF